MTGVRFAYQPIVDLDSGRAFAFEALIRGEGGEGAASVLGGVEPSARHVFDRDARACAIGCAARLGLADALLSLNFLPASLETVPDAITHSLDAAAAAGLPGSTLLLEVTEGEIIHDARRFARAMDEYRTRGLRFAIDDFGAGYSGLNLLAEFQPDAVKLDMQLVRDIDSHGPRQAIVGAVIQACEDLGIEVIAEGVEQLAELQWFQRRGVRLFQGYLLARPGLERLPSFSFP